MMVWRKININKLKEYRQNNTLVVIITNVIFVQKKSKLKWDSHLNAKCNAKPKGFLWTNSKPRPNKPSSLLWTCNDCTDEIEWMPNGEPRFKEKMLRKCRINSRKRRYNKSRTTKQLYTHKYVPTTIITTSMGRKYQGNMFVIEKKNEVKLLNVELLTMSMNEQPPLWHLAHLLDPRERGAMDYKI
jgi:hypothetical protein